MTNGINSPLGLEPRGTFTGASGNFALTYPYQQIASAYGTSIFIGDPVSPQADGTIGKTIITSGTPYTAQQSIMGVFAGCVFTNSSNVVNLGAGVAGTNYWVAGTVLETGTIATANIVGVDPNTYYTIQSNNGVALILTNNFNNAQLAYGTPNGNTQTGISTASLDQSTLTTSLTASLRIWGLDNNPYNQWGISYNNVIVTINNHFIRSGVTGV